MPVSIPELIKIRDALNVIIASSVQRNRRLALFDKLVDEGLSDDEMSELERLQIHAPRAGSSHL